MNPSKAKCTALNLPEGYKLVQAGKAAMSTDSGVSWQVRKQQTKTMSLVPMPIDKANDHTSPMFASGVVMSSGTTKPDAAWRWMSFLSQQAADELSPRSSGCPRAYRCWRAAACSTSSIPTTRRRVRFAFDHVMRVGIARRWAAAFTDAIESILKDGKSIEQALADAQTKAKDNIAEAAKKAADATPVPTVVVAAPKETPVNQNATTIKFSLGTATFNAPAYRDLAKRFTEANPDIVVEIKQPDLTNTSLDIPDVAKDVDCFMWAPSLQDPKNLEAILNLEPFLDADKSFDKSDFYPATLDQFTEQGQLWALPAEVTPYVIEYNRDLFDAAKVAYPKPGWTMDDFLATAKSLTKGDGDTKQYGYVGDYFEANDLVLMLQALGAKLVDTTQDPPKVVFDDATMRSAMQWYADLHSKHDVKPMFVTDFAKLLTEAYDGAGRARGDDRRWPRGDVERLRGHAELDRQHQAPDDEHRGRSPSRSAPAAPKAATTSRATAITSRRIRQAKQACWKWITYLTGAGRCEAGLARAQVGGGVRSVQAEGGRRTRGGLSSQPRRERHVVGV